MIYLISYPISDLSNQVLGSKILCRSAVCVYPDSMTGGRSCMAWASSHCSAFCREGRNQTPSELSMETKVLGTVSSTEMITNDILWRHPTTMKTWQASRLRKRNLALQPPLKHVHTEVRGEAARSSLLSAGHPHPRHEKLQCKPLKT